MYQNYQNIKNDNSIIIKGVKMKYLAYHPKEKGIVLLSCLVFLLILLGVVRFVMTSSRLEERKAGVDYEMMTARQSAQMAIRYAEKYIIDQGFKSCIRSGSSGTNTTAPGNAETKCREKNPAEAANDLWKKGDSDLGNALSNLGQANLLNKGIYTYSFVKTGYSSCRPFWTCVNWTNNAKSVEFAGKQLNTAANARLESIECEECVTSSGIKPRFVIERFLSNELKDMEFPDSGLEMKSKDVVVFRITAVGFGNGEGGPNVKTTNAMMQAIYVLNG